MHARLIGARLTRLTLALAGPALALLLAPLDGHAAPPDAPAAGLVLLPVTGSADAAAVTSELEQAFARVGKPAQLSALKLDELMLAVECNKPTVECLQKIGANIQVAGLIMGQTRASGEGVELSLRLFDVKSGGDLGRALVVLPTGKPQDRARLLDRAVRDLFGIKQPPRPVAAATGGLEVSSNVKYVEVTIDGQPRGATPLELRNLKVGAYRVEASRSGYVSWRGVAEVKADQMTRLEIEMAPSPETAAAPGFLESIRLRTWIVAGIGVACLGAGVAVGAHMSSLQSEMDQTAGDTFEEIARMQELRDEGDREAVAANVLLGVGGAALLTTAFLAYLDYRRGRSAPEEPAPDAPPRAGRSAHLLVGPGSVGLRLAF